VVDLGVGLGVEIDSGWGMEEGRIGGSVGYATLFRD